MSGHNTGAVLEGRITRRGTSNANDRGNSKERRARREWLVATYRADVDLIRYQLAAFPREVHEYVSVATWERRRRGFRHLWASDIEEIRTFDEILEADVVLTCRCYRCGKLLTVDTVTVDRIIPGCQGGTYRRSNIRPACGHCNSETGGRLGAERRAG